MAALYRKYRSQTFDELIGQESVVTILKNQLQSGTLPHALLFTGPRGTGKTSTARIVSKSLNCLKRREDGNPCSNDFCENCKAIIDGNFEDLIEIDAASNRGIEEIRTIKENVNLLPLRSKYKIYIIDEAHMLTREAFNALLKVLEEPPTHIIFMLCTTEASKILPTIVSRCEKLELSLASIDILVQKLKYICDNEGVNIDDGGLKVITELGAGSFRDSESLLEKVFSAIQNKEVKSLNEEDVRGILGMPSGEAIAKIIANLNEKKCEEVLVIIDSLKSLSPQDFIKTMITELTKDFVKNNEIIKFMLDLEQSVKLSQHGYIIIKSRIIEWCRADYVMPSAIQVQKNIQPQTNKVQASMPQIEPTVIEKPKVELTRSDGNFTNGWKSVVDAIAMKNKPLKFILAGAKADDKGGDLNIYVTVKLHKDLLDKKTAKDIITEFYEKVFGKKPAINIIYEDRKKEAPKKESVDLDELFNA